jgi:hypothetical protein
VPPTFGLPGAFPAAGFGAAPAAATAFPGFPGAGLPGAGLPGAGLPGAAAIPVGGALPGAMPGFPGAMPGLPAAFGPQLPPGLISTPLPRVPAPPPRARPAAPPGLWFNCCCWPWWSGYGGL